jgi:hypothetical protein
MGPPEGAGGPGEGSPPRRGGPGAWGEGSPPGGGGRGAWGEGSPQIGGVWGGRAPRGQHSTLFTEFSFAGHGDCDVTIG